MNVSRRRIRASLATAGGIAALGVCIGAAAAEPDSSNRVVNGGAESGTLDGWTANGFAVGRYGDPDTPSQAPSYRMFRGLVPGATLTQVVSFADRAEEIDSGQGRYGASAYLGAAGSGADGMLVRVQPLDAGGAPLGSGLVLGPPTASDRQGQPQLIECFASGEAPMLMRSVRVTLEATGSGSQSTAMADGVLVASNLAIATYLRRPAEGPNCYLPGDPTPTPTPTASPTVTPAASPTPTPTVTVTPTATPGRRFAALAGSVKLSRRHLRFRTEASGRVGVTISRGGTIVRKRSATGPRVSLDLRKLKAGRYRVRITATGYEAVSVRRRVS